MNISTFILIQGLIFILGSLSMGLMYFWVDPTQNPSFFFGLMCLAFFLAASTGLSLLSFFFLNIIRRGYVFFLDMVRILRRSVFAVMLVLCLYFFDRSAVLGPVSFLLIVFIFLLLEMILSKVEKPKNG